MYYLVKKKKWPARIWTWSHLYKISCAYIATMHVCIYLCVYVLLYTGKIFEASGIRRIPDLAMPRGGSWTGLHFGFLFLLSLTHPHWVFNLTSWCLVIGRKLCWFRVWNILVNKKENGVLLFWNCLACEYFKMEKDRSRIGQTVVYLGRLREAYF